MLAIVQYTLEDNVLYKVEGDGALRVVPPVDQRKSLFLEAHGGRFGAHLSDAKVYSELQRHYWWVGIHHSVDQGVCHLCYPECGESCEATSTSNSSCRAL